MSARAGWGESEWADAWTQMQAMHDVVQAGYARYIGMSSCFAYQCASPTLH